MKGLAQKNKNKNKKFAVGIIIAVGFYFCFSAQAAPDNVINYQGKLTNTSDVAVADGNYSFTFAIYDAATGGNCLWVARGTCAAPTAKTVAVSKGIFNSALGESGDVAIPLDFNSNYWLSVKVGTDSEMDPRRKITASGFAVNSGKLNGQDAAYYLNTSATTQTKTGGINLATSSGSVGVGTTGPGSILDVSASTPILTLRASVTSALYGIEFKNVSNLDAFIKQQPDSGELRISSGRNSSWGGYQSFYTDTTEKMRLSSTGGLSLGNGYVGTNPGAGNMIISGNVGIGTTNPLTKFQVNGHITLGGGLNNPAFGVTGTPVSNTLDFARGDTYFGAVNIPVGSATTGLWINSSGNVGIGTTAPLEKLQVYGGQVLIGNHTTDRNNALSVRREEAGQYISATRVASDVEAFWIRVDANTPRLQANNDDLILGSWTGAANIDALTIKATTGNVGIGTTNPTKKLVIADTVNTLSIGDYSSTGYGPQITSSNNSIVFPTSTYWGDSGMLLQNSGSKFIMRGDHGTQFDYYDNISAYKTAMTISGTDHLGNVMVGDTTPTANFQVGQRTAGAGTVSTPGNSTTLTGVGTQFTNTFKVGDTLTVAGETVRTISTITSNTVLDVTVAFSATPRSAVAYTLTGGTRFSVLGNGNVGIGTTSPAALLSVGATSQFQVSTAGAVTAVGVNSGTGLIQGTGGLTITGAAISLNHDSNFAVAIADGTSTGAVTIGGGSNTFALNSTAFDVSTAGALSGITTLGMSGQLTSTLAVGTSPFAVTSTTINTNLNADLLDGQHGSYYAPLGNISGTDHYIAKFNGTSALENSLIFDNGTNVGIGTTAPDAKFQINIASGAGLRIGYNSTSFNYYDADTHIFRNGNGTNTEWMRMTGGNVGVGTTNPVYKLSISNSTGNTALGIINSSNDTNWQLIPVTNGANTDLRFYNNSTYPVTFQTGGNVGIGTTNPTAGLYLKQTYGSKQLTMEGDSGYDGARVFSFYQSLDTVNSKNVLNLGAMNNDGTSIIRTIASFNHNGNVGIGTTAPGYKLDVNGQTNTTYLTVGGASIGANSLAVAGYVNITSGSGANQFLNLSGTQAANTRGHWITFSGGSAGTTDRGYLGYSKTGSGSISLWTNEVADYMGLYGVAGVHIGTGQATPELTITAGNVGVGTTNPNTKLNVIGDVSILGGTTNSTNDSTLYVSSSENNDWGLTVDRYTGNATEYGVQIKVGSSASYGLRILGNGSEVFRVQGNGNIYATGTGTFGTNAVINGGGVSYFNGGSVGIGTTNPKALLHTSLSASGDVLLFSNGLWPNVPRNPQMISASITTNDTTIATGPVVGLNLENSSQTDGMYSPFITFSRQTGSGTYNSIFASIGGFAVGNGPTNDWVTGHLVFGTAGTANTGPVERMRITNQGNVGIGTTAPAQLLSLSSSNSLGTGVNIINTDTGGYNWNIFSAGSAGTVGSAGSLVFRDSTNGVSRIVIKNDGNVGIGTTAPQTKLHLYDAAADNALRIGVVATGQARLEFSEDGSTGWSIGERGSDDNFYISNSLGGLLTGTKLFINTTGNVGIGTTNPGAKLDVLQTTTDYAGYFVNTYGASGGTIGKGLYVSVGGNDADDIIFNARGFTTDVFRILGNGNVGIGTTAPGYALDVKRTSGYSELSTWSTDTAGGAGIYTQANAATNYGMMYSYGSAIAGNLMGVAKANYTYMLASGTATNGLIVGTTVAKDLSLGTNGAVNVTVQSGGNVGIGTTSPATFKLETLGSIGPSADNLYDLGSAGRRWANIYGGNFYSNGSLLNQYWQRNGTNLSPLNIGDNVGIGTTGPNSKLDVYGGNFSLTGTSVTTGLTDIAPTNVGYLTNLTSQATGGVTLTGMSGNNSSTAVPMILQGISGADPNDATPMMAFRTGRRAGTGAVNNAAAETAFQWQKSDATALMTMLGDGNVGIGTTNPGYKLDVNGTLTSRDTFTVVDSVPNNVALMSYSGGAGILRLQNAASITTQIFANGVSYFNGGNVGIGTTNPTQKLQVDGAYDVPLVKVRYSDTVNGGIGVDSTGTLYGTSLFYNGNKVLTADSNYGLIVGSTYLTGANTAPANGMIIEGNVGIGTTGPGEKLEVAATAGSHLMLKLNAVADKFAQLGYYEAGTLKWNIFNDYANDNLAFGTSGGTKMVIQQSTGNVGVGTTNPGYKLHVADSSTAGVAGYFNETGTNTYNYGTLSYATGAGTNNYAVYGEASGASVNNFGGYFVGKGYFSGNVGIGTTAPGYKLTVENNDGLVSGLHMIGGFQRSAGSDAQVLIGYEANGTAVTAPFIYSANSQPIALYTSGSNRLHITSAGNVGIGTTNPSKNFQLDWSSSDVAVATGNGLSGGTTGSGLLIQNTNSTSGVYASLDFRAANADGRIAYKYTGTTNVGDFYFITDNTGSPEAKMVIQNGGNVGIGTTNPGYKLHVYNPVGTNAASTLLLENAYVGQTATVRYKTTVGEFEAGNAISVAAHSFEIYDRTNSASRLFIKSDGSVGIGTTAPVEKLNIYGGALSVTAGPTSSAGNALLYSTGTLGPYFAGNTDTSGNSTVAAAAMRAQFGGGGFLVGSSPSTAIGSARTFTDRFIIDTSGSVGIGTTSPLQKLDVRNGAALIGTDSDAAGTLASLYFRTVNDGVSPMRYTKGGIFFEKSATGYGKGALHLAVDSVSDTGNVDVADAKLTILEGGNVGIGTTNPTYLLTVADANLKLGYLYVSGSQYSPQLGSGASSGSVAIIPGGTYEGGTIKTYGGTHATLPGIITFSVGAQSGASPEKVRIDASGNVGIGMTNPSTYGATLGVHVGTDMNFGIRTNAGLGYSAGAGVGLDATTDNAGGLTAMGFRATSYQFNLGSVGIGTTNPANALDIANANGKVSVTSTSGTNASWYSATNTGGTFTLGRTNSSGNNFSGSLAYASILHSTGAYPMQFFTNNSAQMIIESGGNVGIGTTAPGYKLDVTGIVRATSGFVTSYQQSYGTLTSGGAIRDILQMAGDTNLKIGSTASAQDFTFQSTSGSLVTIKSGGNVGIGTTAPGTKLEIAGIPDSEFITFSQSASYKHTLSSYMSGTAGASSLSFNINNGTGAMTNNVLVLKGGGNVGIGTTAPAYTLDVSKSVNSYLQQIYNTNTGTLAGGLYIRTDGTGNLLTLNKSGSDIVTISDTVSTFNNPTAFTAAGDVSMAYDLVFNNSTASYVKSAAPLYLEAGEVFNSSDLTLRTFNSGDVVFDAAGGLTSAQAQTWNLAAGTSALNFVNAAGTTLMNIDSTNARVGIGTTAPGVLLTLASSGYFGWDNGSGTVDTSLYRAGANILRTAARVDVLGSIYTNTITQYAASNLVIGNASYNIQLNGNVGIGTTGPSAALHVKGISSGSDVALFESNALIDTRLAVFQRLSGAVQAAIRYEEDTTGIQFGTETGHELEFYTNGASNVRMAITSGGNVGIGTTNPIDRFEINDGTNQTLRAGAVSGYTSPADYSSGGFYVGLSRPDDGAVVNGMFTYNTAANVKNQLGITSRNDIVFMAGTGGLGGSAEKMRIDTSGNVGIGTTDPAGYKLNVSGTVNIPANTWITANGQSLIRDSYFGYSAGYRVAHIGGTLSGTRGIAIGIDPVSITGGAFTGNEIALPNAVEFMQANAGGTDWIQNVLVLSNGSISTSGSFTSVGINSGTGLIQGTGGLTVTGAAVSLNASSNFAVNVATGTSTGTITLGGTGTQAIDIGTGVAAKTITIGNANDDTFSINSSGLDVSTTGALSGITTLGMSGQLTSTLAIGTSPFAVTSTTVNTNLNADLLDGQHGSYYAPLGNISGTDHYVAKFNGTSALENSLLFDNGTNVGIGTTAPGARLDVVGVYDATENTQTITAREGGFNRRLDTRLNSDGTVFSSTIISTGGYSGFMFKGGLTPGTGEFMRITSGGNVGIGITNPTATLHIRKAADNHLIIDQVGAGLDIWQEYATGNNYFDTQYTNATNGNVYFRTQTNSTPINAMFIKGSSGNVGIGTTAPLNNLHVVKTYSNTIPVARFDNGVATAYSGTNFDTMLVTQPDVPALRIIETNDGTQATQQELSFAVGDGDAVIRSSSTVGNGLSLMVNAAPGANGYNESLGTLGIKILNSGNVGIGTTGPGYQLQVGGNAGTMALGGALGANSTSRFKFLSSNTVVNWQISHNDSLSSALEFMPSTAAGGTTFTTPTVMMRAGILGVNGGVSVGSSYYTTAPPTDGMIITGNVGIGTTAPGTKAEVYRLESSVRTTYSDILTISAGANTNPFTGHGGGILFRATNYDSGTGLVNSARIGSTIGNSSTSHNGAGLFFDVSPSEDGVLSRAMTIKYDGNVGIGTTNPTEKLHVMAGATYVTTTGLFGGAGSMMNQGGEPAYMLSQDINSAGVQTGTETSVGGMGFIYINSSDYNNLRIGTQTNHKVIFRSNNLDRMTINNDGNVGIGTTDPAGYKLNVSGTLNSGAITSSGALSLGANTITSGLINGQTISSAANFTGTVAIASNLNVGGWTTTGTSMETSFNIPMSNTGDGRWDILEFSYDTANWHDAALEIEATKTGYSNPQKTVFFIKRGYGNSLDYEVLYGGNIVGYWHSETVVSGNIKKATFAINRSNYNSFNIKIKASTVYSVVSAITGAAQIKVANAYNATQIATTNTGHTLLAQTGGNVGIGMTAPGTYGKLELKQTSDTSAGGIAIANSAIGRTMRLWVDGNNISRIDSGDASAKLVLNGSSTGSVGIGNTAVAYKLDISTDANDTANNEYIRFDTNNTPGAQSGGLLWRGNYSGYTKESAAIRAMGEGDYFRLGLGFFTGNIQDQTTSAVERMRISMSGNVGIGITNPGAKLDVLGPDATSGGSWLSESFRFAAGNYPTAYGSIYADMSGTGGGMSFGIAGTKMLYIAQTTGNIGIGTNVPKNKLDIEGGAVIGATYSGTNTAPSNGLLVEGSVGIGMTNPTAKLDISAGYGGLVSGASYAQIQAINNTNTCSGCIYIGGIFSTAGASGGYASTNYGLTASASGGSGSNVGIYTTASGTFSTGLSIGGPSVGASSYAIYSSATAQSYFAGSVGIGTTAPGTLLNSNNGSLVVSGSGNVRIAINSTDNNAGITLAESGVAKYSVATYNGGNFSVYDIPRAADSWKIDSRGNFTSIGADLVAPTLTAKAAWNFQNAGGELVGGVNTTSPWATWLQSRASSGGGALPLALQPLGGNVGIGTTNPGAKLEVTGDIWLSNAANRTIQVASTASGNGSNLTIGSGNGVTTGNGGNLYLRSGSSVNNSAGNVYIYGALGSSSVYGNVILAHDGSTAAGNVGIGTTAPGYKLDVYGDVYLGGSNGGASGFGTNGVVTSNPTTNADYAQVIRADSNYIYIGGTYIVSGTNSDWRIEKRNITTGALVTAFDTDGIVTSSPTTTTDTLDDLATDGSYIYALGSYLDGAYPNLRVEKRDITTGALVTAFDSDGILIEATYMDMSSIAVDANYIYLAGWRYDLGESQGYMRIEKRNKTTGALVTAFDTDGVAERVSSTSFTKIVIDSSYVYAAGTLSGSGLYVEKRDITTGALVTAFGSSGYIYSGYSIAFYGGTVAIDANYVYLTGHAFYNDVIEKRDITTGASVTAFGSSGIVSYGNTSSNMGREGNQLTTDTNYIYTVGYNANYKWRIEKRNKTDGLLVDAFGPSGMVQTTPTPVSGTYAVIVNATDVFVAGYDVPSDARWRIEKRNITTGALTPTVNGLYVNSSTGSVGIGTVSPGYNLDVAGYVRALGYYTGDIIYQANGVDAWRAYEGIDWWRMQSVKTGQDVFTITGDNRLGIGTNDPTANLSIVGDGTDSTLSLASLSSGSADDNIRLDISRDEAKSQINLQAVSNSGTFNSLNLNPLGGNVGIGTTSPSSKLEISGGDLKISGGSLIVDNVNLLEKSAGLTVLISELQAQMDALKLAYNPTDLTSPERLVKWSEMQAAITLAFAQKQAESDPTMAKILEMQTRINRLEDKLVVADMKTAAPEEIVFQSFADVAPEVASSLTQTEFLEDAFGGNYTTPDAYGEIRINNSGLDLSQYEVADGYLKFQVYMENTDSFSEFVTELGNETDIQEIQWNSSMHPYFFAGWNTVSLKISDGVKTGEIDWANLDYFRIYFKFKAENQIRIKDVKLVMVKTATTLVADTSETILPLDGETSTDTSIVTNQQDLVNTLNTGSSELQTAQIQSNTEEISLIKSVLGLDNAANASDVDILGKLSAEATESGQLLIKVNEEAKRTIGEAVLYAIDKDVDLNGIDDDFGNDGKKVFVPALMANAKVKIFVTSKKATDQSLAVTSIVEGQGFFVEVKNPVSEDLPFDWWMVEESGTLAP